MSGDYPYYPWWGYNPPWPYNPNPYAQSYYPTYEPIQQHITYIIQENKMSDVKTVTLPEDPAARKEKLSNILRENDIVSISDDGNALSIRPKNTNENLDPVTRLPILHD